VWRHEREEAISGYADGAVFLIDGSVVDGVRGVAGEDVRKSERVTGDGVKTRAVVAPH